MTVIMIIIGIIFRVVIAVVTLLLLPIRLMIGLSEFAKIYTEKIEREIETEEMAKEWVKAQSTLGSIVSRENRMRTKDRMLAL